MSPTTKRKRKGRKSKKFLLSYGKCWLLEEELLPVYSHLVELYSNQLKDEWTNVKVKKEEMVQHSDHSFVNNELYSEDDTGHNEFLGGDISTTTTTTTTTNEGITSTPHHIRSQHMMTLRSNQTKPKSENQPIGPQVNSVTHTCPGCDFTCAQRADLTRHLLTHHTNTTYSCSVCNIKCAREYDLNRHLQTHTDAKPFSCYACNFTCTREADFKLHLQTHTYAYSFSCSYCDFTCGLKADLSHHRITSHPNVEQSNKQDGGKPLSCPDCSYTSVRNADMNLHLITFHTNNSYYCSDCYFTCALECDLKCHLLTHTDVKPYSCPDCDYTCSQIEHLSYHEQHSHR